jgi:hypothetical protein
MNANRSPNASVLSVIPPVVTYLRLRDRSPWRWVFGGLLLIALFVLLAVGSLPTPIANSRSLPTIADLSPFPSELPLSDNIDGMVIPILPVKTGPSREEIEADCETTRTAMREAAEFRLKELQQFFETLRNDSDSQSSFAEALLSLEAKSLYVTGQGYQGWCEEQFQKWILEPKVLSNAFNAAFAGLSEDLLRIRAEQYVRLGIDDELAVMSEEPLMAKPEVVRNVVKCVSDILAERAAEDIPESAVRMGLGFVAGEAARAATNSIAGSSPEANWLGLGVEIIAGLAADSALEQMANPTGRFVGDVKVVLKELEIAILNNATEGRSMLAVMNEVAELHYQIQRQEVAEKLNLRLLPPVQTGE